MTSWCYGRWFQSGIIRVGEGYLAGLAGVDHSSECIQSQIMRARDWMENLDEMLSELIQRTGCTLSRHVLCLV